ncbi:SPOR domain-containing protein [Tropicibacter oceani]|uniref:SPOR domain-containing protein n=1 Tax=Tropicibacter oceani TaxID=3058420 RepID=A0ABY8QLM3_9RHOB|nr:SPOR domain-containing protein [Tropicibacter oceani]WGW05512.1 SPOR domain-containing protein [Tropicibacter oceani]
MGIVSAPAQAQSNIAVVPANFPPASYTGRQFVDNKGCVFVRAGFDGNVTWVPRVTRQRQHICGQTPTFGGTMARAPEPAPSARPVVIGAPDPAPVATAAAPRPGVTAAKPTGSIRVLQGSPDALSAPAAQTAARQPAPQVRRVPASKPVAAQPPRMVRRVPAPTVTAPAPAPRATVRAVPAPRFDNGNSACVNGTRTRQYNGQTLVVRCGPQTAPHVTVIRRGEAPGPGKNVYYNKGWQGSSLAPETRIVPRHVYEQQAENRVAALPEGYRPAWEDDRLNPYRAHQTVAGYRATQQVWTNTVPRILVSQARRHSVKDPVIAYNASGQYRTATVSTKGRVPVVSSRSAPKPAASGARFVEIGVFTTEAKAQAAAARLTAAGLPVRFGSYTKGGQTMRRVMVGPYASAGALNKALAATKSAGYPRAYLH